MLCVVYSLRFVVCCLMCGACRVLLIVGLLFFDVLGMLVVCCGLLSTVGFLIGVYCLLIVCCLLLVKCCKLLVMCSLLLADCLCGVLLSV